MDNTDLALYMMKRKFSGNNVSVTSDKEYNTFLEMIRDMSPLPDPEFKEGDVQPIIEDAGAALDKIDAHDTEFKKLIEDMFEDTKGFQKLTQDEIETRIVARKENELSDSKTEEGNGRSTGCVASGEQTIYTSSEKDTTLHPPMSETTASVVVPTLEDAGDSSSGKGNELDSWTVVVA
jgi:hypothetical protein